VGITCVNSVSWSSSTLNIEWRMKWPAVGPEIEFFLIFGSFNNPIEINVNTTCTYSHDMSYQDVHIK